MHLALLSQASSAVQADKPPTFQQTGTDTQAYMIAVSGDGLGGIAAALLSMVSTKIAVGMLIGGFLFLDVRARQNIIQELG